MRDYVVIHGSATETSKDAEVEQGLRNPGVQCFNSMHDVASAIPAQYASPQNLLRASKCR